MLGAIRRQWWRDAWAEIAAGEPRRHPVVEALTEAHRVSPLPLGAVEGYLDAREAEQDGPPSSLQNMKDRAAAVGGGIAGLEAACLGQAAPSLGAAWVMVGELRALPLRLRNGRHGLPADRVAALDPDLERLDPNDLGADFTGMIQEIVEEAETLLRAADVKAPMFRGYRRMTLHYTRQLRKQGWNPFAERINARTLGRAWSVAGVKLRL